jgi:hypothetical protein
VILLGKLRKLTVFLMRLDSDQPEYAGLVRLSENTLMNIQPGISKIVSSPHAKHDIYGLARFPC